MLFYIITNINVIGIRSWRLCIFFGYILYLRVEKEVEEEQRCRMFCIYAAGCTNPHIVIVAYSAIRTDSTKTHIVIITNRPIGTDGTQAHVVSIPDSAVFLDSANPHVVIIPDGAIIEDLSNTHIIGIANCSVRLNFAKQHVVVVAERLGITRACNKQERQYSDNKSIHHVAKLQIITFCGRKYEKWG